jgi:DNA-binding IclR family transcriptional regulator
MATPKNQSVVKAFAVLKAFYHSDEWVNYAELSRRANLPKASGYRILQTLEEVGAVVRGSRGFYRPGMLLVSLSRFVAIGDLLRESCEVIGTDLARRFNLTIHVGMLEDGMVTYVAKFSTPTAFPVHTRVGAQLEPYCSGLGKILLAALPAEELEDILMDGRLVALTPYTITDRAALRTELRKVRQQGYAVDDRENQVEMSCLAVPICDGSGKVVAAISATDSARNMTAGRQGELHHALLDVARALSLKVYPRGPKLVA